MTTIVTAIYGGFDVLRGQVEQDVPCDWVCFTDDPDLTVPAPWRIVYAVPEFDRPRLAAKVHRMRPAVDDPDVIWLDGSHQITCRSFAREALRSRRDGIAAFRHPRRDDIYLEAAASIGSESQGGKYDDEPIMEQVEHYRSEGHPAHGGLWATGTIAWDRSDPRVVEFGEAWLAENVRFSVQDQLSFPVVARRLGVTPGFFPVRQIERGRHGCIENRWQRIWPHQVPVG